MQWTQELFQRKVGRILEGTVPGHRAVLEEYEKWLREVCCFAPATVAVRVRCGREFLATVAKDHPVEVAFGQLTATGVESFFVDYSHQNSIAGRRCMTSSLRRLLQYAAYRGWCSATLIAAVPRVFSYRLKGVPIGISDTNVERVLESLKPDSATRCRDLAVLRLLATYGPRTGQIAELRLRDLAWRQRQITFCAQKKSKAVRHILTAAVAETIALYLRSYRPQVQHDHVFALNRQPLTPLTPAGIRGIVRSRLKDAGVDSPLSPRAFRYALVTRLLDARQPYKLIADSLGHMSFQATAVYTKMNRPYLEEAAGEWQELVG